MQEKYVCVQLLSRVLFAITRTIAHEAPLFMEFSWREHWSGLPFPSPGDLTDPGIELMSLILHWQARSLPAELLGKPYSKEEFQLSQEGS